MALYTSSFVGCTSTCFPDDESSLSASSSSLSSPAAAAAASWPKKNFSAAAMTAGLLWQTALAARQNRPNKLVLSNVYSITLNGCWDAGTSNQRADRFILIRLVGCQRSQGLCDLTNFCCMTFELLWKTAMAAMQNPGDEPCVKQVDRSISYFQIDAWVNLFQCKCFMDFARKIPLLLGSLLGVWAITHNYSTDCTKQCGKCLLLIKTSLKSNHYCKYIGSSHLCDWEYEDPSRYLFAIDYWAV